MALVDTDLREARGAQLEAAGLNGLDFVLVTPLEDAAVLELHFLNATGLAALLASAEPPQTLLPISGGHRVRAGAGRGEVRVEEILAQVSGTLPIAAAGLTADETLTVEIDGDATAVALAAGTTLEQAVAAVSAAIAPAGRAIALDGRLAIAARTFALTVSSSRPDPHDGGSTGFDVDPRTPPDDVLALVVRPLGDYSTYTLRTGPAVAGVDPVFSELGFKFRPGCFTTDCDPDWVPAPAPPSDPPIDYLAKDYDSFRHVALSWMASRVPGWEPTSEADLTQTLIALMSAAADELSDYQDRVMNEAYLSTARGRVSLARHARLMDYHVHQGNQASTTIAVELVPGTEIRPPAGGRQIEVWAGRPEFDESASVFRGSSPVMHSAVNRLVIHTWGGARPGLAAGDTSADLAAPDEDTAIVVRDLIAEGIVRRLLIAEARSPLTGSAAGANPAKRQLLELDPDGVRAARDPLTEQWFVSVRWRAEDALRHDYCFSVQTPSGAYDDVSLIHGNLVDVAHGRLHEVRFHPPGAPLPAPADRHHEPTTSGADGRPRWGTLCRLPADRPLLYRATPRSPEHEPRSTLEVEVNGEPWEERISLLESRPADRHFAVETDELGRSVARFGNGLLGENLPADAVVLCRYQTGRGPDGNIGRDRIVHVDRAANPEIETVWNPFDVVDGRAPESPEVIRRSVPEAYAARQLRAITLADYVARAEEVSGVARAAAAYAWTGSWRTVRVTIDPLGTDVLAPGLRAAVARHLEPLRLVGEDLELRAPEFVPLRIVVHFCVVPDVWPADVVAIVEQELSDGYTPDGRPGFFHPDLWTFGQALHSSQLLGRLERVAGIAYATSVELARWDAPTPGAADAIEVGPSEIVRVRNDPDHMELGSIELHAHGGRG
jgi:hypothetical protein